MLLTNYFDNINERQMQQFAALFDLYAEWNEKINVISRKDIDNFEEHHLLHSLAIAKIQPFKPHSRILDVGTGGGFPGIPLAILFPDTNFVLVDSIGKKIKVVQAVADAIGLANVTALHQRAEETEGTFDFIVSRAVTNLSQLVPWVKKKISRQQQHALPNGLLVLKGGDLADELKPFGKQPSLYPITDIFPLPFYENKYVVHLPLV